MSEALDIADERAPRVTTPEDTRRRLDAIRDGPREHVSAEGASRQFLETLADLGPVFTGFARFLATRADVTPAGLRADLGRVGDRIVPASAGAIREVLEAEWRRPLEQVCWSLEEIPIETRFPTQSHRAWLSPTDSVIVTCVTRDFEARLERELQTLPVLSPTLAAAVGGERVFDRLVDDYCGHARSLVDLSADLEASAALVADAQRFPALRVRRPHPGLSGARVAVWDDVASVAADSPGFNPADAGASACRAWLRQALLGAAFPEDTIASDFIAAGRREVALAGRRFRTLPRDAQLNIQGYLVATAAGDQDLAIRYLSRELVTGRNTEHAEFVRRIRHAWSTDVDAAGGSELMAQLLLHWRVAVAHGYQPAARLVSFYRGCLSCVAAASAIGAEGDPLRDALGSLQIRVAASQAEALVGVSLSTIGSAREAEWRLLNAIAFRPLEMRTGREHVSGLPVTVVAALLLVLAAIGFAVPPLVASGARWADVIGAALFGTVGAVTLLRIMLRSGGQ